MPLRIKSMRQSRSKFGIVHVFVVGAACWLFGWSMHSSISIAAGENFSLIKEFINADWNLKNLPEIASAIIAILGIFSFIKREFGKGRKGER